MIENPYGYIKKEPGAVLLYYEMKPNDRIIRLFEQFVSPKLLERGFKFSKSQKAFKKRNGFFEYTVSIFGRKFNSTNHIVSFGMNVNVFSAKYKKWEPQYYSYNNKMIGNSIDGGGVEYQEGWDNEYMENGYYDLMKYDNELVMKRALSNIEVMEKTLFMEYDTLESAILNMKRNINKHFIRIFDFYIINNQLKEAVEFFDEYGKIYAKQLDENEEAYGFDNSVSKLGVYLARKAKAKEFSKMQWKK